jgi:cystathionine beta-lyase
VSAPEKPPGRATALIAHPYVPPATFGSTQPAVHKGSTVLFADTKALRARDWRSKAGYTYGLHGTPTTFTLEARIAALEGGTDALLVPSGLAAICLVDLALLGAGDEVVLPDNVYGPNRELARHELARSGVVHRLHDPMRAGSLEPLLSERTKLVWIEAPGSVTMEFPDVPALVAAVRARAPQAVVAIDDTWSAGLAYDAFALGCDVAVHALTKYPSGGGDVLMGAVTTRDEALHQRLKATHMRMGWGVGGNDAELVLRSLPSLPLRYAAQDAAGRAWARWWQGRPECARVLHPALEGSPGHAHWKASCRAAAGLFSVVFDPAFTPARVDAFVDALRLVRIGYSWAGPVSLAVPYDVAAMRPATAWSGGALVRFSVGLEDVEDLIADCAQALAAAAGG